MAFELFDLTGKRAFITGSSQGIGFALAQGLAEHGAEIVLNGRDAGKLEAAAAKLEGRRAQGVGGRLRRYAMRRPPRTASQRSRKIPARSTS